jgi:cell division protein FtsQ
VSSTLLAPRGRAREWHDLGEATVVAHQRVGRGRRRRRRRLARPGRAAAVLALSVLGLLLAGGGVRWLLTSPRFAVGPVDVRGTSRVATADVLAAAAVAPGTSIFRIDADGIVDRVEAVPGVLRAEVVREWPGRVAILVEERRPFTLVHAGRLHWMDEEGRLLGEEPEAVSPPVPVISGLSDEELITMRTAPGPRARAALALIRALLRSGSVLVAEISEIDMSRPEGPVLYTTDGIEVRLGTEDWEERLARLERVLAQVAGRTDGEYGAIRAVDLRFRDQVVLDRGGAR